MAWGVVDRMEVSGVGYGSMASPLAVALAKMADTMEATVRNRSW